jgi:hypothetical protein
MSSSCHGLGCSFAGPVKGGKGGGMGGRHLQPRKTEWWVGGAAFGKGRLGIAPCKRGKKSTVECVGGGGRRGGARERKRSRGHLGGFNFAH